jgi:VanZ family protein
MTTLKKTRNIILAFSHIGLAAAAATNIVWIIVDDMHNPDRTIAESISIYSNNFESIFFTLVTLVLTFSTRIMEKAKRIDIPDDIEIIIVVFIYMGIFLSFQFKMYYKFFWWDDLLHFLSGLILGYISFIVVYKINHKYCMDISPLFVAFFSFTFAVSMGVMWEILEFTGDVILGSAHQKWNLPETEILLGKTYQGSGLRDTMSDLILDSIGALISSVSIYFKYSRKKQKVLDEMKKMILENNDKK